MANPNAKLLVDATDYLNECWGYGYSDGARWHIRVGEVCSLMQIGEGRSLYVKLRQADHAASITAGRWNLSVTMLNDDPPPGEGAAMYPAFNGGHAPLLEMVRLIQFVTHATILTSKGEREA